MVPPNTSYQSACMYSFWMWKSLSSCRDLKSGMLLATEIVATDSSVRQCYLFRGVNKSKSLHKTEHTSHIANVVFESSETALNKKDRFVLLR